MNGRWKVRKLGTVLGCTIWVAQPPGSAYYYPSTTWAGAFDYADRMARRP